MLISYKHLTQYNKLEDTFMQVLKLKHFFGTFYSYIPAVQIPNHLKTGYGNRPVGRMVRYLGLVFRR